MARGRLIQPLVSVIIPTYHPRPQFLRQAIESVLAQTVQDFECIVVDDGAPEPVQTPQEPRVRLVRRSQNGGVAAAWNTGIGEARGRYVAFLDDDDMYTPDRLALGLEGLSRATMAICWSHNLDDPPDTPAWPRNLEGDVSAEILERPTPFVSTCTLDRGVLQPFDERIRYSVDVEWWVRQSQAATVTTVPKVGHLRRRHQGPRMVTEDVPGRIRSQLLTFEIHRDYFASRPRAAARRWRALARLARKVGDYAFARAALQRSLRLHPDLAAVRSFLACSRPSTVLLEEERRWLRRLSASAGSGPRARNGPSR